MHDGAGPEYPRGGNRHSAAAGAGRCLCGDGEPSQGALPDRAGGRGPADQLRSAHAPDSARPECGVCRLSSASTVCVGVVAVVARVSPQRRGDRPARIRAGGFYGVGRGGVLGPVYHLARLEGGLSAGSRGRDYRCDRRDVDRQGGGAAAKDRRHPRRRELAERRDRAARARDRPRAFADGTIAYAGRRFSAAAVSCRWRRGHWADDRRGGGVAGAVHRRRPGGAGGQPGGSVCGLSRGRKGEGLGRACGGGVRHLSQPQEHAVLLAGGAPAGSGSVAGAYVHAERPGVRADRTATAVCAGRDSRQVRLRGR